MKTAGSIPNLDDIIFEKRNKLYGAYELRKNYHKRLSKSLMVSVSILLSVFLFSVIRRDAVEDAIFKPVKDSVIFADNFTIQQYQPPQKPAVQTESRPDERAFIAVRDTAVLIEKVDTLPASSAVAGVVPGDSAGDGNSSDTISLPLLPSVPAVRSMASVDKIPEFPGGMEKFYSFLTRRIRYTEGARRAELNGKLYVRFVIDEEGFVRNVTLMSKIGYGLDEQVAGVLAESPRWMPGMIRNSAVKTEMILPVSFNLR